MGPYRLPIGSTSYDLGCLWPFAHTYADSHTHAGSDSYNELNVVTAGLFSLRVSINGGATFLAAVPAQVPATHVLCGDPSLAFDSQGRAFWSYLGCVIDAAGNLIGIDIFIAQVNPATGAILGGYPVNVTASAGVNLPGVNGFLHDKEWLAADRFIGSPFQDRLYIVWTDFAAAGTVARTTFSSTQGNTWSPSVVLSAAAEGFVWPSHNAVAANGDVYAAYHSQPSFTNGAPDGTSGHVFVLRSTNGGVAYPQTNLNYTSGNADITFNVQPPFAAARQLSQNRSWSQGSAQPWVLPDPNNP